jgi:hypothetical protein
MGIEGSETTRQGDGGSRGRSRRIFFPVTGDCVARNVCPGITASGEAALSTLNPALIE